MKNETILKKGFVFEKIGKIDKRFARAFNDDAFAKEIETTWDVVYMERGRLWYSKRMNEMAKAGLIEIFAR